MPRNKRYTKKRDYSSEEDPAERTLPVSSESESESNTDNNENNENIETMPIPEEIIYPGLVLKKEYVLLKKIGFGNNAGVWMTYKISTKSYFAIKIQDNQCYQDGCREVAIINRINKFCAENKDRNIYCVKMLDYFVYEEDEETKYVCSIYDLYAGSIFTLLDNGKYKYGFPIPVVKKMIRQLLTALSALHGELGIIHTDIKPENILFKGIPSYHQKIIELFEESDFQKKHDLLQIEYKDNQNRFMEELEILALDSVKNIFFVEAYLGSNEEFIPDDVDEDEFIEGDNDSDEEKDSSEESESEDEYADKPDKFNERKQSIDDLLEHLDYKQMHDFDTEVDYDFIKELNNREFSTDKAELIDDKYVLNCQTALTDFGNSYFFAKRTRNEIQDRRYRAPEIILDFNYKYACDIWSVSCVTFELLTGFVLFEPANEPLNKDIHHLYLMEKNLGKMPITMKMASKRHKFLFDKTRNYHIKNIEPFEIVPLRHRLVDQFLFTETEADEIYDFLMCGLNYDPNERLNAMEMLQHPWLNK